MFTGTIPTSGLFSWHLKFETNRAPSKGKKPRKTLCRCKTPTCSTKNWHPTKKCAQRIILSVRKNGWKKFEFVSAHSSLITFIDKISDRVGYLKSAYSATGKLLKSTPQTRGIYFAFSTWICIRFLLWSANKNFLTALIKMIKLKQLICDVIRFAFPKGTIFFSSFQSAPFPIHF